MDSLLQEQLQSLGIEPISKGWFDLPFEIREIIIDEMDAKTRCRFAECSKLCEKEAKESKNYMFGIMVISPDLLAIAHEGRNNYVIQFNDIRDEQTLVVCRTGMKDMSDWNWSKVESGKATDVRLKYFIEYTMKYKNSINGIKVHDKTFSLMNHNLKHVKDIQQLDISHGDVIKCGYLTMNQINHSAVIFLEETNFTFDEIIRLKGYYFSIRSDDFDEEGIIKLLKMWKNGELSKLRLYLTVRITRKINIENIMKGLDVFDYEKEEEEEDDCMFRFFANHQIKTDYCTQIDYFFPYFHIDFLQKVNEKE